MARLEDVMLGVAKDGRLTEYGLESAYEMSRTMDYYTANATALLYTEIARLVALRLAAENVPGAKANKEGQR